MVAGEGQRSRKSAIRAVTAAGRSSCGKCPTPARTSTVCRSPAHGADAAAVRAKEPGVVGAVQAQHRRLGGPGDGDREPAALGPQLRPHRPPVVLHRAVGRAGDARGGPVAGDGVPEVVGGRPLGARPPAHGALDAVPHPQHALGPPRQLEPRHGQQRPALAARLPHDRPPDRQRVRRGHRHHRVHPPWVQRGDRPPHDPAPPVPDDRRPVLPQRGHQPRDVPASVQRS